MDDLISRQDAIDVVRNYYDPEDYSTESIEDRLKRLPSAQPEVMYYPQVDGVTPSVIVQPEIIRCKECKHYYYADNRIPQEQRYSCDLDGDRWKPDDFCSYAERRTDETD